jgi:RNA polymerase sigma-70 factor (ECF subfamily)
LARARSGDAEAFGEICRAYEARLLRQAYVLCRNEAAAEDLAEDTLVEAWRSLRRYNGQCQFFTWLCAILLNHYRNTLRRARAAPLLASDEPSGIHDQLHRALDPSAAPDEAAQFSEQARLLRQCIERLSPRHQQVIYLRFYVDDSLAGIARALGCSVGTVKSRLFHALEKLRSMNALTPHSEILEKE